MLPPRAEIARERRRMVQVRQALAVGLGQVAQRNDPATHAFCLACADYLGFSMRRLYEQDGLIHELLSQRIPEGDREARERLGVLAEQQRQGRVLLAQFIDAAQGLRDSGHAALPAFTAMGDQFVASFNSAAEAGRNPFFRYTDDLFTAADWERIAAVTPSSLAEEERLYGVVRSTAPAGADPASFPAGHAR